MIDAEKFVVKDQIQSVDGNRTIVDRSVADRESSSKVFRPLSELVNTVLLIGGNGDCKCGYSGNPGKIIDQISVCGISVGNGKVNDAAFVS